MSSQIRSQHPITVVMHTYDRPDFVEIDVADGRWEGIPLLVADDGSRPEVQARLKDAAAQAGAQFTSRETNGGPALAARDGVQHAGTEHVMLCGDDDYLRDFHPFAAEATALLAQEDTLFVSMPEVRMLTEGKPEFVQYDRRVFDGVSGLDLLRDLVFGGEMRALQAGTALRRTDALPHFAGPLFRTSEDFVLLVRLCAAFPNRKIRVPSAGAYMRREHARSLSHRTNMSTERVVANLLALLVGCRLLQRFESVPDEVIIGLLRQRGQVLATVYGQGVTPAQTIEALLTGKEMPKDPSAAEALSFLKQNTDHIPDELRTLKQAAIAQDQALPSRNAVHTIAQATLALESGDIDKAASLIEGLGTKDPEQAADLMNLEARIRWERGDAAGTAERLASALVKNPEHAESLHMLAQIAAAAGEDEIALRLQNRLIGIIGPHAAAEFGITEHADIKDLRVAFIVSEGLDQFLSDIIRELIPSMDARMFVVSGRNGVEEAMAWADVCWFEWCNDPVIWASRQDVARKKPVICRLHRYEAFTDMPLKVHWENVDALVLVAEHVETIVEEMVPGLGKRTDVIHIPNGVDLSRYPFKSRQPGFDIALVGYLHARKNPGLALQILAELVRGDSRYRLHVAGKFQDPALQLYWSHMVNRLGLAGNVVMYEWQSDIAAFLEDKHYLISTSTHESFGYSIAEAMACGIKPIVHNFAFASDMWAQEMLFNTVREAVEQIRSGDYHSEAYRAFIADHYSLESQVEQIRGLILSVAGETSGARIGDLPLQVTEVLSIEPQMVNVSMRCRCPACRAETVIQQQTVAGHPVARERCPSCGSTLQVGEEVYYRAIEWYDQEILRHDSVAQTRAIGRVAASWHEDPLWASVMTVDGINLGAVMEFDLSPGLVKAWLAANAGAERQALGGAARPPIGVEGPRGAMPGSAGSATQPPANTPSAAEAA